MDKRNGKRPNMKPGNLDYQDGELIGFWTWLAIIFVVVSIAVMFWLT